MTKLQNEYNSHNDDAHLLQSIDKLSLCAITPPSKHRPLVYLITHSKTIASTLSSIVVEDPLQVKTPFGLNIKVDISNKQNTTL